VARARRRDRGRRPRRRRARFRRDAIDFRNLLLAELPNGDFAHTIVRQALFDAWHVELLTTLGDSRDERIAAIAAKGGEGGALPFPAFPPSGRCGLGDGTAGESRPRAGGA
jgi:hypothetical protein